MPVKRNTFPLEADAYVNNCWIIQIKGLSLTTQIDSYGVRLTSTIWIARTWPDQLSVVFKMVLNSTLPDPPMIPLIHSLIMTLISWETILLSFWILYHYLLCCILILNIFYDRILWYVSVGRYSQFHLVRKGLLVVLFLLWLSDWLHVSIWLHEI